MNSTARITGLFVLLFLLVGFGKAADKTRLVVTEAPKTGFVGTTDSFVVRIDNAVTNQTLGGGLRIDLYDGGTRVQYKKTLASGRVRFDVPLTSYGWKIYTVKFYSPDRTRWISTRLDVATFGRLGRIDIYKQITRYAHSHVVTVTLWGHLEEVDGNGNSLGPIPNVDLSIGISRMSGPSPGIGNAFARTDVNGNMMGSFQFDMWHQPAVTWGQQIRMTGYAGTIKSEYISTFN